MCTDTENTDNNNPYIFSRGSLKLTFDLIRKKNPQLALTIRNISNGIPQTNQIHYRTTKILIFSKLI